MITKHNYILVVVVVVDDDDDIDDDDDDDDDDTVDDVVVVFVNSPHINTHTNTDIAVCMNHKMLMLWL